mmetsp:Transcript_16387/g.46888  ORF Transcript_16387/g.46888 Transcript_16387/m.46888 type:complete len:420 (+) Transcript_16387:145-1404(+)
MRTSLYLILTSLAVEVSAFIPAAPARPLKKNLPTTNSVVVCSVVGGVSEEIDDDAVQWELFNKHHAKGSWRGVWTTHDYIGDVIDETVASVDLNTKNDGRTIEHTHTIVVGAKKSDCATCFDSMETKTLPVASYSADNLRNSRFAAVSMVNGPTILRSGAMATELVLKHGDGRVRVIFQHAPVWEQGVEPGSCPPQGLKLFRCMISREALRPTAPTPETETKDPPTAGNPVFFRPVPPFNWHKKWSGTSWTWGPQTGNRGWEISEMEETDAWHGITPVEQWNLRMGPIHVQCPRIITDATVGVCRLAWLPDDETLLRMEAGVQALQPMVVDDDMMVGFEPPSLSSLRCDMMKKIGELENVPIPSRDWKVDQDDKAELGTETSNSAAATSSEKKGKPTAKSTKPGEPESGLDAIRDALSL